MPRLLSGAPASRLLLVWTLLVATLVAVLGHRARPTEAANPSTVSGEAYGVTLTSMATTITKFPDVVLDPQGGSSSAAAAGVNVPAVLSTGTISVDTQGTSGTNDASSQSTSSS